MDMPESRTLPALLEEMARRYPDRLALVYEGQTWTYTEFLREVRELAKAFHALGVRKGDKVALLMGNQPEWLFTDFAVTMLGGVLVAFNTWWRAKELEHGLAITDTKVLVMVDRFGSNDYVAQLGEIPDLAAAVPTLERVIHVGDHSLPGSMPFAQFRELGRFVPDAVIDDAKAAIAPEDAAYLLFTSGSTARSKAVTLVHRGLIENMHGIGERMHLTEQDRVLMMISLFWSFVCANALFATLTHGATIVLQHRHDIAEMLRLIEAEQVTAVYTQPNIVLSLYRHPDRLTRDLSSWRTGVCRPTVVHLLDEIGAKQMSTSYGLTECYGNSVLSDGLSSLDIRRRSSGPALPNTEILIVDQETRAELPRGTVGEVLIRGYVTPGYYKDPERTAQAIDPEGWFHTGDLGLVEPEGYFQFRGRIKELIKTGGINVTPADVEELLDAHPDVQQSVVVGVPDAEREEIVAAMVVPKPGHSPSAEDLMSYCRRTAAQYKAPRFIAFVGLEEVPLTDTGKIHKDRVKAVMTEKYRNHLPA